MATLIQSDPKAVSASYGKSIPVVYGTMRVTPQIILMHNRRSVNCDMTGPFPNTIGTPTSVVALDVAAMQFALCEGPIDGIGRVWVEERLLAGGLADMAVETGTRANWVTALGTLPQAPWAYLVSTFDPKYRLGHGATAWIAHTGVALFSEGKVPRFSVEVQGFCRGGQTDAHPADVVVDLLTNTIHGLGLPTSAVEVDIGPDGLAASSYRTYCTAMGWRVSGIVSERGNLLDALANLLDSTNATATYIGGKVKIIPNGDTAKTAGGVTYTPPSTTVALGLDDFAKADHPVAVKRRGEADTYNECPVSFLDKAAEFTRTQVSAPIDGARIVRASGEFQSQWIVDRGHAMAISRLMAQRSLYCRNVYEVTIHPKKGTALEPGDLVSLTDSVLGLSARAARVIKVEEDGDDFAISAEEWPAGAATVVTLNTQTTDGISTTPGRSAVAVVSAASARATAQGAQVTADAAVVAAGAASSSANARNRSFEAASAPPSPIDGFDLVVGDIWYSDDTTTNCPDTNCQGHALDTTSGDPLTGARPHRILHWPHRWDGAAWKSAATHEHIIAAAIDTASLSALSANLGTCTAGKVQSASNNPAGTPKTIVDADNCRIVFDNGTVVKATGIDFGTSSQFIEWVGLRTAIVSGGALSFALCDESNAISYVTKTGSAFFKGEILTTNLAASPSATLVAGDVTDTVPPAGSLPATTSAVVVTASGGLGGYSYLWQQVDGTAATVDSPTSATTTFTRTAMCQTLPGNVVEGRYRCRVTDSGGNVVYTAPVTARTTHIYDPI